MCGIRPIQGVPVKAYAKRSWSEAPVGASPKHGKIADGATLDGSAAEILAAAEREAIEVRRAAREDRDRFREELVGLLGRLEPAADEARDDDYY